MQIKKKAFSFLSATLLTAGFLSGYLLGVPSFTLQNPQDPSATGLKALSILLLLGFWLLVDSLLATDFGMENSGPAGLVRWTFIGFATGLISSVIQYRWARGLSEQDVFRSLFDTFGSIAIFSLIFWLVFQRNIWAMPRSAGSSPSRAAGWLLLAFGMLFVVLGLAMASVIRSWNSQVFLPFGFWLCGIGMVLGAFLLLFSERFQKKRRVMWFVGCLFIAGVIASILGFIQA